MQGDQRWVFDGLDRLTLSMLCAKKFALFVCAFVCVCDGNTDIDFLPLSWMEAHR